MIEEDILYILTYDLHMNTHTRNDEFVTLSFPRTDHLDILVHITVLVCRLVCKWKFLCPILACLTELFSSRIQEPGSYLFFCYQWLPILCQVVRKDNLLVADSGSLPHHWLPMLTTKSIPLLVLGNLARMVHTPFSLALSISLPPLTPSLDHLVTYKVVH